MTFDRVTEMDCARIYAPCLLCLKSLRSTVTLVFGKHMMLLRPLFFTL